jgi:hypothetical protein
MMRWWLVALVLALGASEAGAQNNVPLPLPVEPFPLTTPVYPSYGDSIDDCESWSPPTREKRRGQEDNPGGVERRPRCPTR